jgi:adenylylsulfate kinase
LADSDKLSRSLVVEKKQVCRDNNLVWHAGNLADADREKLLQQKPLTIWFTGLSGSGKSTLAFALEKMLIGFGKLAFTLDGDNVRHGLCRDLTFSAVDRSENIRRVAEVAHLMNQAGLIVITSCISPYDSDRKLAKSIIGEERFLEVYLSTPLDICERLDPKGLYRKARAGLIPDFTGVNAPYEVPVSPLLSLDTSNISLEECLDALLKMIVAVNFRDSVS